MKKFGSTTEILMDKLKRQIENQQTGECLPCKQKANAIWKISIPNEYFIDPETTKNNFKIVGDVLMQYASFSEAQVQSIFTSIALLPNDFHLIYSGTEQPAIMIHNELVKQGIQPKIDASLNKF